MVDYVEWLAGVIHSRGKGTKTALAKALNLSPSAITKMLDRTRKIEANELRAIQRFLGVSAEDGASIAKQNFGGDIAPPSPVPIIGSVAAGVWRELRLGGPTIMKRDEHPFPPDPRFPLESQFDLLVDDTSVSRVAAPGSRLRCVDLEKAGIEARDGDLVVVKRTKQGFGVETTARRLRLAGTSRRFSYDSIDPHFQHADEENGDLAIQARVLWIYMPAAHKP